MFGDIESLPEQEDHEFKVNFGYNQGSGGGGRRGRTIGRMERKGNRGGKDKAIIFMGMLTYILTDCSLHNNIALTGYRN